MHATFFSMQLMAALAYLLSVLVKRRNDTNRLLNFICVVILTAGIIQLSSKAILFVLVITVNIAAPWFLLSGRRRVRYILVATSITVLAATAILVSPAFRYRLVTELKTDLARQGPRETSDSRLARWETTLSLIKENPVIGYGAGTEISLLQERFYQRKLYDSFLKQLNGHSEYLSITLKSGIIGLLIYFATIFLGFKIAIRRRDLVFLAFMLLIAVVSISENLLDVDKGTIFYAFFFSFFTFSVAKEQEKRVRQPKPPIQQAAMVDILIRQESNSSITTHYN